MHNSRKLFMFFVCGKIKRKGIYQQLMEFFGEYRSMIIAVDILDGFQFAFVISYMLNPIDDYVLPGVVRMDAGIKVLKFI